MSEKFSLLGIEEGLLYTIFSSIGTEHHLAMCLQTTKKFTSLAQRFKDERRILVQNMFRGLKERLDNLMLEDGYSVLVNTSSRITFSSSAKTDWGSRKTFQTDVFLELDFIHVMEKQTIGLGSDTTYRTFMDVKMKVHPRRKTVTNRGETERAAVNTNDGSVVRLLLFP